MVGVNPFMLTELSRVEYAEVSRHLLISLRELMHDGFLGQRQMGKQPQNLQNSILYTGGGGHIHWIYFEHLHHLYVIKMW